MATIDIKSAGGGSGSGTVTSVAVSSTTLTVTGSPITTSGTIVANIPDGYLKVGTGITGSLQNVVDTNGTATTLFLSSTEAQFTSPLRITTSDASGFYLDAEDSATNNRFSIKRDPSAQEVTLDFASNPAGSTTLVGAIRTFGDGVNLSAAMSFIEDGSIGMGTNSPGSKLDVHSTGATVAQFNKTVSGNSYIQQLTAGAGKWKHGFTSATGAFDIIDDVNSLTRLSLLNTGQLKLNAYTSTSAFTGTTAGFLAFDSTGNILSVTSPATSPAGSTGAVQFNNAGAFGADSANFFWDDTNKRLGVGTNAPVAGPLQVKTTQANANGSIIFTNNSAATILAATDTGSALTLLQFRASNYNFADADTGVLIGGTYGSTPTAKLQIKGSGSTSATTSLLVQDSAGTQLMKLADDNGVVFGGVASLVNRARFGTYLQLKYDTPDIDIWQGGSGVGLRITNAGALLAEFNDALGGGAIIRHSLIVGSASFASASARLQVDSTTQGFLPPRMTTAQKNAITTPAAGLMVYDTNLNKLCVYTTAWETITSV